MENMIIVAENIIEQPMVSVLTNFREIFLVGGEQAAATLRRLMTPPPELCPQNSWSRSQVQRLQMVLNAAARLIVGTGKFSHVTPILRDVLHWLPVQHRISYKIAILARDRVYSRHRPGLFRWRLCSGDCSPWTNQPAFSDAILWSCDPSNQNKIGRTKFPYIRTDGVELAPWFARAFCYKPRTFSERTENIPV